MIIYNVTIKVDHDIHEEWLQWMKTKHMAEVVATGCFSGYELFKVLVEDEHDGVTYSAQYRAEKMEQYFDYINNHAAKLRDEGFQKFGNKFVAFRTILRGA